MILLKQSTAADVVVGPFVDDTDGKTPDTALTLAQADCQISKNGGAMAQKNDATSATHLGGGHYKVPLNATDTGTLGRLRLYINKSGALPAWIDVMVMPSGVWDSLFGASVLPVNLTQIGGSAVSTSTAQLGVNVVQAAGTAWGSGAINAAAIADNAIDAGALAASAVAEIVDAVWDESMEGHMLSGTVGDALALATVDPMEQVSAAYPDAGTLGKLLFTFLATASSAGAIADAVWDEALSGHATAGTAGKALSDAGSGSGGGGDITAIDGSATAADNLRKWFDGTGYNAANSRVGTVGTVTGNVNANVFSLGGDMVALQVLTYLLTATAYSLVAPGTNTTTIVTTALPSAVNSFYVGKTFIAISGANAKQGGKLVVGYDGATKRLTIEALTAPMTANDLFILVG